MKVSFYTVESNLKTNNGYGYAGSLIRDSLTELGHTVKFNDRTADVQLNFCQPTLYSKFNNQYTIGYTPWESSSLPKGWKRALNSVNEVWTTSTKCREWFESEGIKRDIYVYEHGIEPIWSLKKRNPQKKLRFLHVGEPAPRKGGQMALDAFIRAFGIREDVSLTIKAHRHSTVRVFASHVNRGGPRSILGLPHEVYKNVTVINDSLSTDELVALYHSHDVLVYPSWGEGFGLIPLQALATGMPTMCTGAWAPYSEFLNELDIPSRIHSSPWPDMHPGMMYEPDFNELVDMYRDVYSRFSYFSELFFEQADDVHDRFNWKNLTEQAFRHLENN